MLLVLFRVEIIASLVRVVLLAGIAHVLSVVHGVRVVGVVGFC